MEKAPKRFESLPARTNLDQLVAHPWPERPLRGDFSWVCLELGYGLAAGQSGLRPQTAQAPGKAHHCEANAVPATSQ
ncbi:hypothetical protein [Pseudomonas huaxiensis]|uniref:hypothetical protein n=1 Tax=Pseudomonas huaxiensis TaxID=2213017 RepID=UPI001300AC30|nr:hypothetical protein [Pseudomonas huaxiensis]